MFRIIRTRVRQMRTFIPRDRPRFRKMKLELRKTSYKMSLIYHICSTADIISIHTEWALIAVILFTACIVILIKISRFADKPNGFGLRKTKYKMSFISR